MFKGSLISLYALALSFFGFGLSVAAIAVQWFPFKFSFTNPEPSTATKIAKARRRRSEPPTSIIRRRTSRRPTSAPAGDWDDPKAPSSGRRVYFADSPKFTPQDKPQQAPTITDSPRSSLSSFSPLLHSPTIISLNDPVNEGLDSDSSPSSRPASYFPRIPKIPNPLAARRRKDSASSKDSSTDNGASPALSQTDRPKPTTSWTYPWSSRKSIISTPEAPGMANATTSAQHISLSKSVKANVDEDVSTITTTTTSSVLVATVSAACFQKMPKPTRRTSTPIPRTQPYAHPINAHYPILDEESPPPPYVKSPIMDSLNIETKVVSLPEIPSKKERNAQVQATLGVGGGRRPSQRRAVTIGP